MSTSPRRYRPEAHTPAENGAEIIDRIKEVERAVSVLPSIQAAIADLTSSVSVLRLSDGQQADGLRTLTAWQAQMDAFRTALQEQMKSQMDAFNATLTQQRLDNRAALDRYHSETKDAQDVQEKRWQEAFTKLSNDALSQHSRLTTDAIALLQETLLKTVGRKIFEWVVTIAGAAALAGLFFVAVRFGLVKQ